MKKTALLLFLLSGCFTGFSQETINTSRPSISENHVVIGSGSIQFENGSLYESDSVGYNTLFRIGIHKRFEIRAVTNYNSPFPTLSTKIKLRDNKGARPGLALATFYDLKRGVTNSFLTASGNFAGDKNNYTSNVGFDRDWWASLAIGRSIGNKLSLFAEYAYYEHQQVAQGGFSFLLHADWQLDAHGGWLSSGDAFAGVGLSFRVN